MALLRHTAAVNPDAPETSAPPRRRPPKAALFVSLAAATLLTAGGYTYETYISPPGATPAAASTPTPTTRAATPDLVATPGAPPVVDKTCDDSAAWDSDGGTSLIDAYINNQDSGNINPETLKAGCPQYLPTWQKAQGGFSNGTFAVPADVKPGTYETTSSDLDGCYWERSRQGQIIDNRFITASKVEQRVTIRSTDDTFVTRDCGSWVKVG